MRTVFVNPSRRRRRSGRRRRRNSGISPFVRNPSLIQNPRRRRRNPENPVKSFPEFLKVSGLNVIAAGAGAGVNRLAISFIKDYWIRNVVRVVSGSVLAAMWPRSTIAACAAGAIMAPILPESESYATDADYRSKNPQELAAELASLLEADLAGDDDLSDDLEDGDVDF